MYKGIETDLNQMKQSLSSYLEKGCVAGYQTVRDEPSIAVRPTISKIMTLRRPEACNMNFFAVDCSTRTLKRANNWGIYLFRASYSTVRNRIVDWGFKETIRAINGDPHVRRKLLQEIRLQLESEMALKLVAKADENDYILLDGASYFGGERKFNVLLYEECEKEGIKLLAISKRSPMLHDEKGRDLIAATYMLAPQESWVYYPVKTASIHDHLYGDVSIIKLSPESPRAFRCDIMGFLTGSNIEQLITPLRGISGDPRCLGYPVALWLAHDFSSVSASKLLQYHVRIEETLAEAGLLEVLRHEEMASNFADELHGAKYAFNRELD